MNITKKVELRHNRIREILVKNDVYFIADFCRTLNVSEATIRNDLTYLEEKGVLKRIRGGAISTDGTPRDTAILVRNSLCKEEKAAIAKHVVHHILKPKMTITLDPGSTCRAIAQEIIQSNLECTVITNSFVAAEVLVKSNNVTLYLAGGKYDYELASFHDEQTTACLSALHSDIYFLSPDGIDVTGQITTLGTDEHFTKMEMMRQAKRVVVVGDYTKIGRVALKVLCEPKDIFEIVVDDKINKRHLEQLRATGVHVEVVE